ncbi:MAG: extracellular solute-binding protein [Oscillospiraceae bacterium]|nr:extracellular solute-binding protein [Oscillospiraceae bacterium]
MQKKRHYQVLIPIIILVALTAGCAGNLTSEVSPLSALPQNPGSDMPQVEHTETPPEPDALALTWAERYIDNYLPFEVILERALQEGSVLWYSSSSRAPAVARSFMEQYPGIDVQIFHINTEAILERFPREHAAGIRNVDIIVMSDSEGVVYKEFVQRGLLHNYFPYDIVPHIYDPSFMDYSMPMYITLNVWFYNPTLFPDGSPISSWWDVTLPEWNGRVLAHHPLHSPRYLAQLVTLVRYADEMAADYERVFGRPIQLHPGSPTAGHEFIRRFLANNPIFITSSSEVHRTVGAHDQTTAFIGMGSSSGLRRIETEGLNLAIGDLTPALSAPDMDSVYIVNEAPNPHAAKLFARWLLGEADGQGLGIEPFNVAGSWPTRRDIPIHPINPPLSELTLFRHDGEFIYYNIFSVVDFILALP